MGDFKYLSEEEFNALGNKERREYLRKKKEFENAKLVEDTLNTSDIKDDARKISEQPLEEQVKEEIKAVKEEPVIEKKEIEKTPAVVAPEPTAGLLNYERVASLMPVSKKQTKTKHKNFLMTEKRFNQFKELANMRGQSENALFNDILTQIFGEE